MSSGYTVLQSLNSQSVSGADVSSRARFRTKDISVRCIYSSDMNFYDQEGIEQKAAEILAVGLLSNLVVCHVPCDKGEYKLISGERRWRALCLLLEQGHTEFERVTCQVRNPNNEHEEMIELILANSSREKDISTLIKEEQILKKELEYMRNNNLKLNGYDLQSGRLRDVVAKILNVSKTKVAEIEAVSNNLSLEFKDKLDDGKISFSAAYQLSKLSIDEQKELHNVYEEKGELSYSDIKDFAEQKELERENEQLPGQMSFEDYGDADPKEEVPDETNHTELEHNADNAVHNVDNIVDGGTDCEQSFEVNNDTDQSYHKKILSFNTWININKKRTLNGMIKDVILVEENNGTDAIANTVALTVIDLVNEYVNCEE